LAAARWTVFRHNSRRFKLARFQIPPDASCAKRMNSTPLAADA